MPKERKKSLCMDTLRHAEYYGMLQTFDDLYAKSKSGEKFPNLMELILSQDNIMLAYRNIKSNTGSYTAGTDHQNIGDIGKLPPSVVIEKVRKIVTGSQCDYFSEMQNMDDEHPLDFLRTNVTLQQFEEFYQTFDIGPGDGMYLAPENRVAVW